MTLNVGFSIQNLPEKTTQEPVTYIIVGMNRGGTSAIAAALDALNIPMGESYYPPIFEDKGLAETFRKKKWRVVKALAHRYSEQLGTYAWKLPDSIWHLQKVHRLFVNPRYIFVYRDIFAISARVQEVHQRDIQDGMRNALRGYANIERFLRRKKPTCMHVSYEKLLLNRRGFAESLLNFTEQDKKQSKLEAVINTVEPNKADYVSWLDKTVQAKTLGAVGMRGYLEGVTRHAIGGWLKSSGGEPAQVDIYLNSKLVATVAADLFREDLKERGVDNNGSIGFRYRFEKPLQPGDEIKVCAHSTDLQLIGSPKVAK